MALFDNRRVRRTRKGDFEVRLSADERDLLRSVAPQLRSLLDGDLDDPGLRRLFPAAYAHDAELDAEYHAMVRDDLADRRRASVEILVDTVDATRLDEEQLLAWMGAVNDLRLVLGTRLDVSEDMDLVPDPGDPDAGLLSLYGYLGYLLETLIEAVNN
ncbi:MAG: DUF2017 family protein [Acidobacteria bacterium]|nr:DUF2017 family protein [Acidobacteriota bacterium]